MWVLSSSVKGMGWSVLRTYSIQYTYGYIYILLEENPSRLKPACRVYHVRKGGTFVGIVSLGSFAAGKTVYMYLYTKNLDAEENPQLLPRVCDTAIRLARVSSLFVASPCRVYSKGSTGVHSIIWLREGPVFGLVWLDVAEQKM